LTPGSTIDTIFADGHSGTFTLLKSTSEASWQMAWACAGSACDGQHCELKKMVSVISPCPELADWIAEIRPTRSQ